MSTATLDSTLCVRTEVGALRDALKMLLPFAQGPLPVHSGVRITAQDGTLMLEVTNGDERAETSIPVSVKAPGQVVVPIKVLDGFLRTVSGSAELEVANEQITVSCGGSSLELHTLQGSEWPLFDEFEASEFELTPELWRGVTRVMHAQGRTEDKTASRHAVRFDPGFAVAMSLSRLAAFEIPGLEATTSVPGPFIATLARLIGPKETVKARFAERWSSFSCSGTTWWTRTIADSYPNWRPLLRASSPYELRVARSSLLTALERTGVLPEGSGWKRLRMSRLNGDLVLTATGPDIGTITDVIECEGNFDGTMIMDVREFRDMVDNAVEDELQIGLVDSRKAMQVNEGPWTAMLMPRNPPEAAAPPAYPTSGSNVSN